MDCMDHIMIQWHESKKMDNDNGILPHYYL